MSIGKIDLGVNVDRYKQAPQRQQQPKAPDSDNAAAVYEPSVKGELTKVSYPPFFPLGNTQGIYEK